jgi:hypothetical protein
MTNQEIAALKPFILVLTILLVYLSFMVYQYREIVKSVVKLFKGGVIAVLVMFGIMENNEE